MSKGAVMLGEFECRQCGHKVSELTLEHQCKKIAADGGTSWQSIVRSEHDLCCESEDFSVNGGADHGRDIFVLRDKGSGYDNVKTRLCPLARQPGRACGRSRRASRARLLRDEYTGLPSEAFAVFAKHFAVLGLSFTASLAFRILAQSRAN